MCSLHLFYWEDANIFIDECGEVVYDLFTVITPQDLYLFHKDSHSFNNFSMIGQDEVRCQIIFVPSEAGLYWMPDIDIERFTNSLTNIKMKGQINE